MQVREKKGPLRAAIPYMPFPVAVICLFLNTFVPGLGKKWGDGTLVTPLAPLAPVTWAACWGVGRAGTGQWLRPVGVPAGLRLCPHDWSSGRWLKPPEWAGEGEVPRWGL